MGLTFLVCREDEAVRREAEAARISTSTGRRRLQTNHGEMLAEPATVKLCIRVNAVLPRWLPRENSRKPNRHCR